MEHDHNNFWWKAIEKGIDKAYTDSIKGMDFEGKKHIKVLDIGCADGTNIFRLATLNPEGKYYGVDIDKKKIATAKKQIKKNIFFDELDVIKNPLPVGPFDFVLCSEVMEHLYDNEKSKLMNTIHTSMKKGGILVITTPTPDAILRKIYESKNILIRPLIDVLFKSTYKERILADFNYGRHHHIGVCGQKYYERLFMRKGFRIESVMPTAAFQYEIFPTVKKVINFFCITANPWAIAWSSSLIYVCKKISEDRIEY